METKVFHRQKQGSPRATPSLGVDQVVEILRARIVDQELPPGSKLRETVLTDEFNVSRPRIREAFGVLEDRGLIQRIPNHGAVVTRLEPDHVLSLFDVREVLEALAVRLATEKSQPESWNDVAELFREPAEHAIAEGNLAFYIDCVEVFRQQVIEAAQNHILAAQLSSLHDRTKVLIRRLVLVPGRAEQGVQQHQMILQAIQSGNAELAEQLKRDNIRSARASFCAYQQLLL